MIDSRKRPLAWAFICALALLTGPAVENTAEAAPGYHTFACRGPFPIAMHPAGYVEVRGKRGSTKASDRRNLLPGDCAWWDRPLASDEPSTLYFPFHSDADQLLMPMLSACAHDSECMLQVRARADGGKLLVESSWVITFPR